MDDLRASNDDTTSIPTFRRPSRAERAVDDPIRDMDDMFVDEYGRFGHPSLSFSFLFCGLYLFPSVYIQLGHPLAKMKQLQEILDYGSH